MKILTFNYYDILKYSLESTGNCFLIDMRVIYRVMIIEKMRKGKVNFVPIVVPFRCVETTRI